MVIIYRNGLEERSVRGIKTRWDINSTNADIGARVLQQLKTARLKPEPVTT